MADSFRLQSPFPPKGDQPRAIQELVRSLEAGNRFTTLLGATGTGKTFTMASVVAALNRPALVLGPNKTLVAQLCSEFRDFFPSNAIEYFVSYYDYYQPEAYIANSDTFIEKDSAINDEVDRLRHSATHAVLERRDTLVSPPFLASTASARRRITSTPSWSSALAKSCHASSSSTGS